MYTYKNIEELDEQQLNELSKQGYKLCYVDFALGKAYDEANYEWIPFDDEDETIHYQAYFTPIDLKDQWGDDWDDAPYEHNAEEPYDDYYDENDIRQEINIYVVHFTVPKYDERTLNKTCDGFAIQAGTTIYEFVKKINKYLNKQ